MKKLATIILSAFVGICAALLILSSCGDTERVVLSATDGTNGLSCYIDANLLICGDTYFDLNLLEGEDGVDGETIVGPQGPAGLDGTSCTVIQLDDDCISVECEDGSSAVLCTPDCSCEDDCCDCDNECDEDSDCSDGYKCKNGKCKKNNCNNGGGNGSEGCSPGNGNDDE